MLLCDQWEVTHFTPKQICGALRDLVPFVQLKSVKNTHGEVLILVKLQAIISTLPWVLFKLNKRNNRERDEICSKLTIKTERHQ